MKQLVACAAVLVLATPMVTSAQEGKIDLKKAGEANAQLALAYIRENDLTTAREKLEKAMDQDPHSVTTQLAAGFLYDRLGEDSKANSHFEEALKLSRNDPNVMNSYGVFLCLKMDKKRGEAMLVESAKSPLNRDPAIAYANAGRCARADGRPQDAEKYFRAALDYKVEQQEALFEMAQVEHELGNDLQARGFLERYTAAAPVSAATLWLGYQIERGLGDDAQAARYADQLRKDFATSPEASALLESEKAQK
jgi:type IV pilus assembly protein PilF